MSSLIPRTLETALREKRLIPFVGAGVSRAVKSKSGRPLFSGWHELLERAAKRLLEEGRKSESQIVEGFLGKRTPNYLEAARNAHDALGPNWYDFLRDEFDPGFDVVDVDTLALARAIWRLPSKLLITTNYDHVLRWAQGQPDLIQLNVDAAVELQAMLSRPILRPTVWHLHGHIHDAQKLILTPDGYSALYSEAGEESVYRAALETLRHLLSARTFLFIGFSMEDQTFGDQLEWVNRTFAGAAGPHYLLMREADIPKVQHKLGRQKNIELLSYAEHGEELIRRIEALAAVVQPDAASAGDTRRRSPQAPSSSQPDEEPLAVTRRAFRAVYEYQRQIFDRLADLSRAFAAMGLEFTRWDPSHYARPAKSSTEFFGGGYWAWDFLPAYGLTLSWDSPAHREGSSFSVEIDVEADTGYRALGQGEPDPRYFEPVDASRSQLWIGLMWRDSARVSWKEAWALLEQDPQIYDGGDHEVSVRTSADENGRCVYRYLEVDIRDVWDVEGLEAQVIAPIRDWMARRRT